MWKPSLWCSGHWFKCFITQRFFRVSVGFKKQLKQSSQMQCNGQILKTDKEQLAFVQAMTQASHLRGVLKRWVCLMQRPLWVQYASNIIAVHWQTLSCQSHSCECSTAQIISAVASLVVTSFDGQGRVCNFIPTKNIYIVGVSDKIANKHNYQKVYYLESPFGKWLGFHH